MVTERVSDDSGMLYAAHLDALADAAGKLQSAGCKPVRILDIATGPNGFNPAVVKRLVAEGIDYRLVLSDISPSVFVIGYKALEEQLIQEEMQNVTCVLADARDLRRELDEVPVWGKGTRTLDDVLKNPDFSFLSSGYTKGKRVVSFEDGSFDLVIGCIPYGSINTGNYSAAVSESARVLRQGGYHIVDEMQVETIRSYRIRAYHTLKEMASRHRELPLFTVARTLFAIGRAKARHIDKVRAKLDAVLKPLAVYSAVYIYDTKERIPEQTIQHNDIVKRSVLVHQKV